MRTGLLFSMAFSFTFCAGAVAQETAADLVKKGAVKLTAADIKQHLVGAETEGPQTSNPLNVVTRTLKGDGSYASRTSGTGGSQGSSISGQWTLRDDGAICTQGRTFKGRDVGSCSYWYRLDDKYYVVNAEDPAATASPRTVKK